MEKLIDSAIVMGRENNMLPLLARFRAAFPEAYAKWSQARDKSRSVDQPQPPN